MKIGYSFWGYLGDYKFDKDGNPASTPDGNAFYSWSIISKLQELGHEVVSLMPDRDAIGYKKMGSKLFSAFAEEKRDAAYRNMVKASYESYNQFNVINVLKCVLKGMDMILLEWRFEIPGRNTGMQPEQPDYMIQDKILKLAEVYNIPVIVFDLDYKLNVEDIAKYKIKSVIELGDKWSGKYCRRVEIPFDFSCINEFPVKETTEGKLVYVGNRYERDASVSKYIEPLSGSVIFGNWNEGGRDSKSVWPNLDFRGRIAQNEIKKAYDEGDMTVLIAKDSYYRKGFMTARIIEAVFYGVVPLFPEEFGDEVIRKYCGISPAWLKVSNANDIVRMQNFITSVKGMKEKIVVRMREHLKFMDVSNFCNTILEIKEKMDNDKPNI